MRKYIDLVIEQSNEETRDSSPEEKAVELALAEVESKLRRWEETLERGLLSLEDASHRIRELRGEREGLLRRKVELQKKARSVARIRPIPTRLMEDYIRQMQMRLREKTIGYKREFLREILQEVRVSGKSITLTYRLPFSSSTPRSGSKNARKDEFFTVYRLVEAGGIEPLYRKPPSQSYQVIRSDKHYKM